MKPSSAQTRLWFLQRLDPPNCAYHIVEAFHVRGSGFHSSAAAQAIRGLVARHEPLRTRFTEHDGLPEADASRLPEILVPIVDLAGEADPHIEAMRRIVDLGRQPFDLTAGLLIRAAIYRLSADEHVLGWVIHHIAVDGWSMAPLRREFAELYGAAATGKDAGLAPLTVSYADYAREEASRLASGALDGQIAYWRRQLSGFARAGLITDFAAPATSAGQGARTPFELSPPLLARLRTLAAQEGATLYMVLLAAVKALLFRHGAGDDIAIGSPMAARSKPEYQSLVGFFANTLVMRTGLRAGESFRELLGRVRKTVIEALEHQEAPFDRVVDAVRPERGSSNSPLFSTVLAVHNADPVPLELPGFQVVRTDVHNGTSKFDLMLFLEDNGASIEGYLEYDTELFRAESMRRFAAQLTRLLAAIAASPEESVSRLTILSERERAELLSRAANETKIPEGRVDEIFATRAAERPSAIALADGDRETTYSQLLDRMEDWAQRLRDAGIKSGHRVAIRMSRSASMIAAILGEFRAGAAYVPVDPSYPAERSSFLIENSGAGWVIEDDGAIRPSGVAPTPGDPATAYVMYTSGSTGKPKGVAVPHRAIARLVFGQDYLHFGPEETFLHMSSISFDASTIELWGALLHGAKLAIAPGSTVSPDSLGGLIARHGVTTLWLTGTYFNTVVDQQPEALAPLRQLIIGGEALSTAHVRRAQGLLAATRIVNGYGPTECTTFACCYPIPPLDDRATSVPIGPPIANTRAYVLDAERNLVPTGAPGELYLGGAGLSLGYWNQPELTAARFVLDPFADSPGELMYRTGDLVRWREDGVIEYLGRLDRQVKVRGYRIEPGEIEAAIRQFAGVRDAVVSAKQVDGIGLLAAHVAATPSIDTTALRAFLRERLPAHMVPQEISIVEVIPYTPNGKVDFDRLPQSVSTASAEFVEPADEIEAKLLDLYRRILRDKTLDARTDFFAAGGHSLLATTLIAAIDRELGVSLPLSALFQSPVLQGLAQTIRAAIGQNATAPAMPAIVAARAIEHLRAPFFFLDVLPMLRPVAERVAERRPFIALPLDGYGACAEQDIPGLARHHIEQIRAHRPHGPYVIGGWSVSGTVAYEIGHQLRNQGEEVSAVILFDTLNFVAAPQELSLQRLGLRWRRFLAGETDLKWSILSRLHQLLHVMGSWGVPVPKDPVPEPARIGILAAKTYVPPECSGRVILVRSAEVAASFADAAYGWRDLITGQLDIETVPGSHRSMFDAANAGQLAEIILGAFDAGPSSGGFEREEVGARAALEG